MAGQDAASLDTCSRSPQEVNSSITQQAAELVAFLVGKSETAEFLHLDPALKKVQALNLDAAAVAALPKGSIHSLDEVTGGKLAGKVF